MENATVSTIKLQELKIKFRKLTEYKIDKQKATVFPCVNNE